MKKKHKIFIIVGTILLSIIIVAGFVISENVLTIFDIMKLHRGMSFQETCDIIGEPHGSWGSGWVQDVYITDDGWLVLIHYTSESYHNGHDVEYINEITVERDSKANKDLLFVMYDE